MERILKHGGREIEINLVFTEIARRFAGMPIEAELIAPILPFIVWQAAPRPR